MLTQEPPPHLITLLAKDGWTDLGANAQIWGGVPNEHTCMGHNAKDSTRNDYAIVNDACLPMVKGVRVLHHEGFLVHGVLQFKLDASKVVTAYEAPNKPKSLYSILRDKCLEDWKQKAPQDANGIEEQDIPEQIWCETKASFHELFDKELMIRKCSFDLFLKADNSTKCWDFGLKHSKRPLSRSLT